jgi:hypothetical protein
MVSALLAGNPSFFLKRVTPWGSSFFMVESPHFLKEIG